MQTNADDTNNYRSQQTDPPMKASNPDLIFHRTGMASGGYGLFPVCERLKLLGAEIESSRQGIRVSITAPVLTE
jgi:hypothetical protein